MKLNPERTVMENIDILIDICKGEYNFEIVLNSKDNPPSKWKSVNANRFNFCIKADRVILYAVNYDFPLVEEETEIFNMNFKCEEWFLIILETATDLLLNILKLKQGLVLLQEVKR